MERSLRNIKFSVKRIEGLMAKDEKSMLVQSYQTALVHMLRPQPKYLAYRKDIEYARARDNLLNIVLKVRKEKNVYR